MSSLLSLRALGFGSRLGCAAVVAAAALAGTSTSASASTIGIHITGSSWGVWITIETSAQNWSNVNADGSAGDLAFSLPGVDPVMGLTFPVPGAAPITGEDSDMVMGGLSISGLGSPTLETASWSLWITGSSGWGIHLINLPDLLTLPFDGFNPDGTLNYALRGVSIPLDFDVTPVGGGPSMPVQQIATDIEWFSGSSVPGPGMLAFCGVGALASTRRRRS